MGINVRGIDIAQSALDSEFKILVLEKILYKILNKFGVASVLSPFELEQLRSDSFKEIQKKYPTAWLTRNQ